MASPVVHARLSMGLSRVDLAQEANIALQTMVYIENGSYGVLPDRVELILSPVNPTLRAEYDSWKVSRRMSTTIFNSLISTAIPLDDFPQLDDIMHPHAEFRGLLGVGTNRYAEELCIARNVIQNYEAGRQRAFPQLLKDALVQTLGATLTRRLIMVCDEAVQSTH